MKMSKSERARLADQIQAENEMLKRVTRVIRNATIALFICALFIFWGFTGMKDAFLPDIPDLARNIVKWIAVAGAVISAVLMIFGFIARHNGKKHLLGQIDRYQGKA